MKFTYFILLLCIYLMACTQDPNPIPLNPPANFDSLGNWEKVGGSFLGDILDVAFVTPNKGYICIADKGVYKSIDSGKTWNLLPLPDLAKGIVTINFPDVSHGYCVGRNVFGYTRNGGDDWILKNLQSISTTSGSNSALDVYFTTPANGFIVAGGGLYQTGDTGTTWQLKVKGNFRSIYFSDTLHGWATEDFGIYHTLDGGNTWNVQYPINKLMPTIYFTDNTNGWITSHPDSTLLRTADGGKTWQKIRFDGSLFDVRFLTQMLGYVATDRKIYQTTDGGLTWKEKVKIGEGHFVELFFLDATKGWVVGIPSLILRLKQ